MILLVGGEKGGTGKTTIATNLAAKRTKEKSDVLLIDTDPQRTASYWCMSRDEHNVQPRVASVQKFDKSVRTEIQALKSKYEDLIIDAGGRDSPELRASLLVADKALIPLRASQFDLWTLARINDLIGAVKDINEKLEAYVFINQASANPSVKETNQARDFFTEFENFKLLDIVVCERIIYRKAAISGKAVFEVEQQDLKANLEIEMLYAEVFQ